MSSRSIRLISLAAVGSAIMVAGACSGDKTTSGPSGGLGGSGGAGGSMANGAGGMLFDPGAGGGGGEMPCEQIEATPTLVNRPVDIIFVIDNSGSMGGEIEEVEKQINQNFATIIDAAVPAIDYRVVMVSEFGNHNPNESICIAMPLGGIPDTDNDGHCDTVDTSTGPVNTAKFFHHSTAVSSNNALCELLEMYSSADQYNLQPNGYNDVLRTEAFKFFVVITDDRVSCNYNGSSYNDGNSVTGGQTAGNQWDVDLLALAPIHFGTAAERNYSFWSIVGLEAYNTTAQKPWGDPHPPDATLAPITTTKCPNDPACGSSCAVNAGPGYQHLSILTGGYRYPTCPVDYTEIFTLMAQGVIEGAAVPCEYEVPEAPVGETLDLSTVIVEYTSGGATTGLVQIGDPANCDASSFYIENDTIKLCPEACALIQADEDAEVNILFGCDPISN